MNSVGKILAGFAAVAFFAFGMLPTASAKTSETKPEEVYQDLIHSDLPLWGEGGNIWPQHFSDGDDFGCTSRVAFGDWRLIDMTGDESWWRLSNYGVFHCAVIFRNASDREDLIDARWEYSFFVQIGMAKVGGRPIELWALQMGTLPGSNYQLLSRQPESGIIKTFAVLQRRCPTGQERKGPQMDIWRTEYCSINSRSELLTLSRRMLRRPPVGTLTLVEELKVSSEKED